VCLIDDQQWLDQASAQVLAFVARRLGRESVGLVFGTRTRGGQLTGLPELAIRGLADDDAQLLLGSVLTGPVDAQVRDWILAETRGNPLALLELPHRLTATMLSGGFGMPAEGLSGTVEESFQRRADSLPPETQRLLLLAAAEPLGDPALIWRAAALRGIGATAARPATEAGLAEFGARVRFRHPLVRSAIYRAASAEDRQQVHCALADATDPATDPDRRAWHLGQAAAGPDESVASELERSAGRAQSRGGLAAGAAFLDRAATLTPDPAQRAGRALAAAQASHLAGALDGAIALLNLAEASPCNQLQQAQVDLLRAQISLTMTRGSDSVSLLIKAAQRLDPVNPRLARETYLDAVMAAMFAGHLGAADGPNEAARAARAAHRPAHDPLPVDLLLNGLAVRFTDGYSAAMPLLRLAVAAFNTREIPPEQLRWLWLAHIIAGNLWDEQTLDTIHHVEMARDSGALSTLPLALATRMGAHVLMGDLPAAAVLLEAVKAVTEVTGIPSAPYGALLLAAWQGREAEVVALVEATTAEALRRREGFGLIISGFAEAMLCNSLGRYGEAARAAEIARGYPTAMGVEPWGVLVELVEGAIRSGQSVRAEAAFRDLAVTTQAAGSDWALGIEARSRALLSVGADAEAAYKEAINRLGGTKIRGELARAHLLYGEWLRREKRRAEARSRLRAAHNMFSEMGMGAFAERAAGELRATGETVRKRSPATLSALTAQETEVARLASEGLSNPEIGTRLFISARTVQYHLGDVFTKMNLNSRNQLWRALEGRPVPVKPPKSSS
jgi:DNA-binding CsgD family transcriptional regulator